MKIYFGGSITGGRNDKDLYSQIIKLLKNYGEVLTEHIGQDSLSSLGENQTKEYIYNRDLKWLKESDYIVAEVTTPSLGVGFEISKADQWNKKIICLYRPQPGKKLSAMISGCPKVQSFEYQNLNQLKDIFDSNLK